MAILSSVPCHLALQFHNLVCSLLGYKGDELCFGELQVVNIDHLDQKETKNGPKTKCKACSKLKFAEFTIRMGFQSNFLVCASEYCRGEGFSNSDAQPKKLL